MEFIKEFSFMPSWLWFSGFPFMTFDFFHVELCPFEILDLKQQALDDSCVGH